MAISVHNSQTELVVTEEMIDAFGFTKHIFTDEKGNTIPYRQYVAGKDLPGKPALIVFLHGAGSVGEENYQQCRVAGPPIVRYFRAHPQKAAVLFPQCRKDFKWVDVPWGDPSHTMPETPSLHMALALKLLDSKVREFDADLNRIYVSGISMGGFGAWDMAARRPELFAGIFSMCGGADVKTADRLKDMAVWCVHGSVDGVVLTSRSRDMVAALKAAGAQNVVYDEVPGAAHNCWDHAYADDRPMEYLFSHPKTCCSR